jgi:uncharacterized membrane protein YsdA (DUF1294 family)
MRFLMYVLCSMVAFGGWFGGYKALVVVRHYTSGDLGMVTMMMSVLLASFICALIADKWLNSTHA